MKQRDAAARRAWSARIVVGIGLLFVLSGSGRSAAEPLSLEDCIDLALRQNPGLATAKFNLKGTEANRLAASSAFLPTVSVQSRYTHSERGRGYLIFEGTRIPTSSSKDEYYTLQSNITQNIVDMPSFYRYGATGADVATSREDLRVSRADLVFEVRQQYYLLLQAIRLASVAKEALDVSNEQLRKSEALFELGSVARTDVLQARVNRATAVQEEISARNSIEQERARLAVLLGLPVGEPLEIRLDVATPPIKEELDEAKLIDQALRDLPEVRRASAQLQAAELRKAAAFWKQFPTLGGSLFYSKQAEAFGEVSDLDRVKENASWGFAVGLSWNIFDGLGTIGGLKNAKAGVVAAREGRRQVELTAALGVREARIAIKNAREGIRAAEESVQLAEENLKLQQALYENGGGTILELNNAQVERTRARNSLVEAQVGLHLAYAQLERALGL